MKNLKIVLPDNGTFMRSVPSHPPLRSYTHSAFFLFSFPFPPLFYPSLLPSLPHTPSPVLGPHHHSILHTDEWCVTHRRTVQTFQNVLSLYNVRVVQSLQDLHLPILPLQGLTTQVHETTFFKYYHLSCDLGRRGARELFTLSSFLSHPSPFLSSSLASYMYLPPLG